MAQTYRLNAETNKIEFLCAYCGNELNKPYTYVSKSGKFKQEITEKRLIQMELCHIDTRCETGNNGADNLFYGHAFCNHHQNEANLELHLDNIGSFVSYDEIIKRSQFAYAQYEETKKGMIHPIAFSAALYVNEHSAARITPANLARYAAYAA
jgi:hypothetical protein